MRAMMSLLTLMTGATGLVQAGEMPWVKDWATAQQTAKSTGKIVMIDFYTDWCGWCKRLDKDTYTDTKVVQLASQFVPIKLNAEKDGVEVAQKYKDHVQGFPTILFLDAQGELVGKIGGYLPAGPFAEQMTKIKDGHERYQTALKTLKDKPDDGEANAVVAWALSNRGKREDAEQALAKAEAAKYVGNVLGDAYNGIGDLYQTAGQFDKAIEYFTKADTNIKDPQIRSYALVSIAYCHLQKGDRAAAKKAAEAFVQKPWATPEYVEMAKQIIAGG